MSSFACDGFRRETLSQPNEKGLQVTNRVAEKQKEMRFTSAEETLRILRDARSGEMFGNDTLF